MIYLDNTVYVARMIQKMTENYDRRLVIWYRCKSYILVASISLACLIYYLFYSGMGSKYSKSYNMLWACNYAMILFALFMGCYMYNSNMTIRFKLKSIGGLPITSSNIEYLLDSDDLPIKEFKSADYDYLSSEMKELAVYIATNIDTANIKELQFLLAASIYISSYGRYTDISVDETKDFKYTYKLMINSYNSIMEYACIDTANA